MLLGIMFWKNYAKKTNNFTPTKVEIFSNFRENHFCTKQEMYFRLNRSKSPNGCDLCRFNPFSTNVNIPGFYISGTLVENDLMLFLFGITLGCIKVFEKKFPRSLIYMVAQNPNIFSEITL